MASRVLARRAMWILVLSAAIVAGAGGDAQAIPIPIPNPLGPIGEALGAGAANAAVDAFDAIIAHLFAPVARFVNVELLGWLVARARTSAAATSASSRPRCARWARRHSGRSRRSRSRATGWPGWPAAARAASRRSRASRARSAPRCSSPLWPWLFDTGVELANLFTRALMGSGSVSDDSARLLVVGLGAAGALWARPASASS